MLDTAKRWPEIKPEIKALLAFPYVQTLTLGIRRGIQKMAKKAGLVG